MFIFFKHILEETRKKMLSADICQKFYIYVGSERNIPKELQPHNLDENGSG